MTVRPGFLRYGLRNDDKSSEIGSPIMIELLPQVTVALNLHAGHSNLYSAAPNRETDSIRIAGLVFDVSC